MRDVNKVLITGRLGRDAELRITPTGASVASFSVASSRNVKQGEEWKEETEWFRVIAWNKLAEFCAKTLIKGTHVYVEGRLKTREWQDTEGQKRTGIEVIAEQINVLGGGAKADGGTGVGTGDQDSTTGEGYPAPAPARPNGRNGGNGGGYKPNNEYAELGDIPF